MYDRRILEKHYIPRINSSDKGHVILDWESEDAQVRRFEVLFDHIDVSGRSILDVGCGIGDLYRMAASRCDAVSYTGIDILPEMVEEARLRHPEGNFITGDLLKEQLFAPGSFDILFSSGIFNLKVGDNHAFLKRALEVFFSISSCWVVFNLLDPKHPVQRDIYYYFEPEEALEMAKKHADHVEIVYDYVPKDYTVFAKKTLDC